MRLCFFGTYTLAQGYPINRVLIEGLERAGAEVELCREELWSGFLHQRLGRGGWWGLGWRAVGKYVCLMRRYRQVGSHQAVLVGYPGYVDVVLARLLNWRRRRLVVLVAFISLYDTAVVDRQQVKDGSIKAWLLKCLDRLAFGSADLVLVDTLAQGKYLSQLYGLPEGKFRRSFVGEDDLVFRSLPLAKKRGAFFEVLFFGTYVPLHGIETVLAAAKLLAGESDVCFTLIGKGQLYEQMRHQAAENELDKVHFIDRWLDHDQLIPYIGRADVCLGIFGQTSKAARVIPFKVFDALAIGRPVITRDSPAVRELLEDGRDALLCPAGDPKALAAAILRLRDDAQLCFRLATQGHARYRAAAAPRAIGGTLKSMLEEDHGFKVAR